MDKLNQWTFREHFTQTGYSCENTGDYTWYHEIFGTEWQRILDSLNS